jgi:hypothetical protein
MAGVFYKDVAPTALAENYRAGAGRSYFPKYKKSRRRLAA